MGLKTIAIMFCLSGCALLSACGDDADAKSATAAAQAPSAPTSGTSSPPPPTGTSGSTTPPPPPPAPPAASTAAASVPIPAKDAGYTVMTYGPKLVLQTSDKIAANTAPIYLWNFFGADVAKTTLATNGDGSITLFGGGFVNGQISSAAASSNAEKKFVGTAFGGGAYFEAVFKFEGWHGQSNNPGSMSKGFPAFWSMAVEHLSLSGADRWPSKVAEFVHFAEFDFFEYNAAYQEHTDFMYTGSAHDWYGIIGETCPLPTGRFCQVQNTAPANMRPVAKNFDFSEYHTYGALWVPATASAPGYLAWYVDGEPIGENITWKKMPNQAALSWPGNYAFAVADLQHMAMILGSGTTYPMTVKSVTVWQKSAAQNWVQ
jgi:hypothetical protein